MEETKDDPPREEVVGRKRSYLQDRGINRRKEISKLATTKKNMYAVSLCDAKLTRQDSRIFEQIDPPTVLQDPFRQTEAPEYSNGLTRKQSCKIFLARQRLDEQN